MTWRRRLGHWLADTGRFAGALIYWNGRKSAYVWRRRRGPCPCQNESDDPVPGRVRCDAVVHWHNPARFRAVCPLLVRTPEGWRCSVSPAEVRPFWSRAGAWVAGSTFGLWFMAVTLLWGALHLGNQPPIAWTQLAWPGRWPEIRSMQSRHLFGRAIGSFQRGRLEEARLMLSTAREIDPRNYDATLLLAQITMFERSFLFADELFLALWRDHPAERARTAITYHDTLISLGRMSRLASYAIEMADADRPRAALWVRSALLGVRLMPAEEIEAFKAAETRKVERLAPHAQLLFQAEFARREGRESEALAVLRAGVTGPINPFYLEHHIGLLAELGAGGEAQLLLDAQGRYLGEFEQRLTQTEVSRSTGDVVLARASLRALLRLPLDARRVERVVARLCAQPDLESFRELNRRVTADATLMPGIDGASLWLAAILCGDRAAAEAWRTLGKQTIPPSAYPELAGLDFKSWDPLSPTAPIHLLNVVTFPRDVILALLARMQPQPSPAAPAKVRP